MKPRRVKDAPELVARHANDLTLGVDAWERAVFDVTQTFYVGASFGGGRRERWEFNNPIDAYKHRNDTPRSVIYAVAPNGRHIVLDGPKEAYWINRWNTSRTGETTMATELHFALTWNGAGPKNASVYRFNSKIEADAYVYEKLPGDQTAHVISSAADLSDRQTFPTSTLVTLYNGLTGANILKFENRTTAQDRVMIELARRAVEPPAPVEEKPAPVNQKKEKTRVSETTTETKSRAKVDVNLPIRILVEKNPCREGTGHWKRFNIYKDGMTLAEYVKAGGHLNDATQTDIPRGFIELVTPSA